MSQALKYMHSFNCIHRDVDPSNILLKVAKKSYVTAQSKLCDFGTAKPILKDSSVYNTVNPAHKPNFCCPKALQGIVGSFTDVYSLGKTMEAFYSAKNPALDAKNPALDGNDISLNWLSFMNMMTTECVEERPEMEEVSSKMREMANSVGAPYIWWTIKSPRKRVSEIVSVEYVDCIAMQSLSLKDEDKEIDEVKIKSIEEIEVKENGKSDEAVASSDEKVSVFLHF
jgi:serine/threonine protein kinase